MISPQLLSVLGELAITLFKAIGEAVGPLLGKMLDKAIRGEDPLDALAAETVAGIEPAIRLEIAEHAARAARAAQPAPIIT